MLRVLHAVQVDNTCLMRVVVDFRKFVHEGSNEAASSSAAVAYLTAADERFRATEFNANFA